MERHQIGLVSWKLLPLVLLLQSCGAGGGSKADFCQTVLWGERATDKDKAKLVTTTPAEKPMPAHTVTGIVTDADGNQLSGARVQLTSSGNTVALTDTTNIAGRFVIRDRRLPATVSLRIDKKGYRCFQLGDVPVNGSTVITIRTATDDND